MDQEHTEDPSSVIAQILKLFCQRKPKKVCVVEKRKSVRKGKRKQNLASQKK